MELVPQSMAATRVTEGFSHSPARRLERRTASGRITVIRARSGRGEPRARAAALKRFRALLREEMERLVETPQEVDGEIDWLLRSLS